MFFTYIWRELRRRIRQAVLIALGLALGWRSRRVVGQVMGESLVIGVGGAVLGVALGYGGTALIDALAPKLTATVGASNAASVTGPGRVLGAGAAQALTGAGHSVSVTLDHRLVARRRSGIIDVSCSMS